MSGDTVPAARAGAGPDGFGLRLRSLLFNTAFFGLTTVLCLAYQPLLLLSRHAIQAAVRFWSRCVMLLLRLLIGLDYEIRGLDRVPAGPHILASEHQSAWETIMVGLLVADPAVVLKKELLQIPLWGWLARRAGNIRVDRDAGSKALKAMIGEARQAIDRGQTVVIFPQGSRSPPRTAGGEPLDYHPGVAALYGQLGLPVLPLALNSGLFWGRRSFVKRPGRIIAEYLPPIEPGLRPRDFLHRLEGDLAAASERLEREALDRGHG
jgi:1-acyl-sn-glycerol-3-phosphate acyltransferase